MTGSRHPARPAPSPDTPSCLPQTFYMLRYYAILTQTTTITSTGGSITASSIYVAIFPIHHHHSSSLALVERRSRPFLRKCEILPATVGLQNSQSSHELIHRVLNELIHRAFNEPAAYPTA